MRVYVHTCSQFTSVFTELLTGCWGGSSAVLSLSESDLELLSESLELVESTPLECAASNELRRAHTKPPQCYETVVLQL